MEAGLDVRVAKVMGWTEFRSKHRYVQIINPKNEVKHVENPHCEHEPVNDVSKRGWFNVPAYGSDPELLSEMLEWCAAQGWGVSLEKVPAPYHWKCELIQNATELVASGWIVFGYAGNPLSPENGGPQLAVAQAIAATGDP